MGARLEYLDINLNTWSLIVFFSQIMFTIAIFLVIISHGIFSIVIMLFFWFLSQIIFLFYGIATDQIGFVLLFLFNLIIAILGIFVKIDNSTNDWEEYE